MPALASTRPSLWATISTPGRWRSTSVDSCKDQLDEAGILAGLLGKRDGARRRRNGREIDAAALRLRDDLLRQHENVAGSEREARVAQCCNDDRREIVAGCDHGNAGKRCEDEIVRRSATHDRIIPQPTARREINRTSFVSRHSGAPRSGEPGIQATSP